MAKITKFTILGERCSGTNYLESLIKKNFDLQLTWKYGHKHFFGFSDYSDSDDTLFIGIYRNLLDWLNSIYVERYHLADHLRHQNGCTPDDFLVRECFSYRDKKQTYTGDNEIMEDRNIYTKKRYKNILELRFTKLKFLKYDMKNKVKNYILISYEDLVKNWDKFLLNINKKYGISLKNDKPINHEFYKLSNIKFYDAPKKKKRFTYDMVKKNICYNKNIEKIVGYKYI